MVRTEERSGNKGKKEKRYTVLHFLHFSHHDFMSMLLSFFLYCVRKLPPTFHSSESLREYKNVGFSLKPDKETDYCT